MIAIGDGSAQYLNLIITHYLHVSDYHIVPHKYVQILCVNNNFKKNGNFLMYFHKGRNCVVLYLFPQDLG
jgi:hypothetical protein